MARVEMASQAWGWLVDSSGNPLGTASATLKNLDATNATHWSAVTGGSSATTSLTSNADGTLPRFVEGGSYDLTVGSTTRRVEAVSGSVETNSARKLIGLGHQFVDATNGSDSNDGKSWGTAKATIGAAKALMPTSGGIINLAPGDHSYSGSLDFSGTNNIHLRGPARRTSSAGYTTPVCRLLYSGTGLRFIDARLSHGFSITGVTLKHTDNAFTGLLVDCQGTDANTLTTWLRFTDVQFLGDALDHTGTAVGVDLKLCIDVTFVDCLWDGLDTDVKGSVADPATSFSNVVKFFGGYFNQTKTAHVLNPGQQWGFYGSVFEPIASGVCQAITCGFRTQALAISGCGFWDGGASGTWVTLKGEGTSITGCLFGGTAGTAKAVVASDATNTGIEITGNRFQNFAAGVDLGAGKPNVLVTGNSWSSVTSKVTATDSGYAATSGYYLSAVSGDALLKQRNATTWETTGPFNAGGDIYADVDLADFAAIGKVGPASQAALKLRDATLYRNASTQPTLRSDVPVTLPTYTTATKPAAANVPGGTLIYVSDGGAGAVIQASTGAAWVNLG